MELLETLSTKFNYWVYIVIMMIGLYAMISKRNLIKKLIGMSIFQTAIMLFYISIGVKDESTIPILYHDQVHPEHSEAHATPPSHDPEGADHANHASAAQIEPDQFANPLPHVLMLTAIVVGVATLGVGLAITQILYGEFGSIEENEILDTITASND